MIIKEKKGEWKIQLIIKINFISSKNFNENRDVHSKSVNVEIMLSSDSGKIIKNLFNSLLQRYQKGLYESMRGSDFVFDYVESLNYIFHKINIKRTGGSYIETPKWIKNKKATINCHNKKDNKCFQYAITTALNYEEIGDNHHRVSKIKPFVTQYDSTDINFPTNVSDCKKFKLNNKSIALNILYVPEDEETIRLAYKSK